MGGWIRQMFEETSLCLVMVKSLFFRLLIIFYFCKWAPLLLQWNKSTQPHSADFSKTILSGKLRKVTINAEKMATPSVFFDCQFVRLTGCVDIHLYFWELDFPQRSVPISVKRSMDTSCVSSFQWRNVK